MVGDALGQADVAKGRLKSTAKQIDIEIESIKHGSSGFMGVVTLAPPPGSQVPLFSDLTDRAMEEFLESLELEARGTLRNSGVRGYLQSLPAGITKHVYTYANTNSSRTVTLESVSLGALPHLPMLKEVIGVVVGVGFEPGRHEIRIRQPEGRTTFTFAATEAQVNSAIDYRGVSVRVLALVGGHNRVLRIEPADSQRYQPSPEDRERLIFDRWNHVLSELAQ
jgi:hypothetical protein